MDSRLGELIAKGYNALLEEREAQKQGQEAKDAQILAEIDAAWAEVERAAWKLLPEFLHPYLRPKRSAPYDRPGAWPTIIIDVPELVPIYLRLTPKGNFNGFQVWNHVYIDSKGAEYKAKVNASNTANTNDLGRALALALELSQELMAKELEAVQLQREYEENVRADLAAEETRIAAKKEEINYLKEAQDEMAACNLHEAQVCALISIADTLAWMAAYK